MCFWKVVLNSFVCFGFDLGLVSEFGEFVSVNVFNGLCVMFCHVFM